MFLGTPKIVKPEKPIDSEVIPCLLVLEPVTADVILLILPLILKIHQQKPTANKVASMFGGTRDKCLGCDNTVYPTEKVTTIYKSFLFCFLHFILLTERENPTSVNGLRFKVTVNGIPYHKSCFKCCHGGCTISPSNYIAHEGRLYCKHHHIQLIKEKGNLSQLEGDHEKITAKEKINGGEVVASEA